MPQPAVRANAGTLTAVSASGCAAELAEPGQGSFLKRATSMTGSSYDSDMVRQTAARTAVNIEAETQPSVAVIDSVDIFRAGLQRLFEDAGYATTTPTAELDAPVGTPDPHLVAIVIRSPGQLSTVAAIGERASPVPLLTLIAEGTPVSYLELIRAGASAILPAASDRLRVISAAAAAIYGSAVIPMDVAHMLASPSQSTSEICSRDLSLIRELACGRTISSLAKHAGYSEHSLHRLLARLYRQLDARNRSEAIAEASRRGLLLS
jgi:DNA-binding NarL/FixJ family response regulator